MAIVAIAFDGLIISGAESSTDGGTWDQWGATQTPTQETDFVYQNTYSISDQVSNTTGGVDFDDAAAIDYTTPKIVVAKCRVTTSSIIDTTVAEGMSYQVGSSGSDYYNYYLVGLYAGDYPISGGWQIVTIDPNEIAFRDAVTGTPSLSAIDYYGLYADISAQVKTDNVVHDRLDHIDSGTGLTLTGGTSTDPDGTFLDFVAADQGNYLNRYGLCTTGEAEVIVRGVLTIGTATAAVFTDANSVLVFPWARVGEGAFGIDIDLQSGSTVVSCTADVFKSLGNASTKLYFDTALEVDGTNNELDITAHGLSTGDYVLYSNEGGADSIGPTTATYYFVRAVTDDSIALYAVGTTVGRQNSYTDTNRVSLTAATAPGENHSIIRDPDNRADFAVSGTSGTAALNSCSFDGMRVLTLTSATSMDGGFILRTGNVVASTATLDNVNVTCDTLEEGDSLFDPLTTLTNITNCSITAGDEGHFARLTSAGGTSAGNSYTGFWAPASGGWGFDTITGVDASTDIITTDAAHGFTTGDAVYYNSESGTDTIGLTNANKYYVNVASTTTVSVHATKAAAVAGSSKIDLSDGSTGETHSLYSSKAAVFNDSGTGITITVSSGDNPSFRNGTGASTTIAVSKDVDVHVENQAGTAIQNAVVYIQRSPATSYTSDSGNSAGGGTFTVNETVDTDQAQTGWLRVWRKSSNDVISFRYASWSGKVFTLMTEISGTTSSAGGSGEEGTQLNDTGADFGGTDDVVQGDAIRNTSDGSWALVDEVVSTSELKTTPLQDGSNNDWGNGDGYSIHRLPLAFTDNDDTVDIPLYMEETDGSGDITTYSHNYAAGSKAIVVRIRYNEGATKYIPYKTSGTIGSNGYNLTAVLQEDEVAT